MFVINFLFFEKQFMKKISLGLILFFSFAVTASAADLMRAYQDALVSDPVYQQAVAERLSQQKEVPINFAPLLPQAVVNGGPTLSRVHVAGTEYAPAQSTTTRGYSVALTLTQTVFNFSQFAALASAKASSKQADAAFNAATQNLMMRVAAAYFAVLRDEDTLVYNEANKKAYAKQLDQINEEFKVGLKTITDVYTARASFDTASAIYIAAQTALANDKENLRAITGTLYTSVLPLSEKFPLISPQPANVEQWVSTAARQNWKIRAAEFANQVARDNIKRQYAGHLPTVNLEGTYNVGYNNSVGAAAANSYMSATSLAVSSSHYTNSSVSLNIGVPIFQGGLVTAETNKAKYNYQVTTQQLEQILRSTLSMTRQSYLGIIAGIQQLNADKQAIKSIKSSLSGLEAGYEVGTQTLVDVLNQQQRVFQIQSQYATDRYNYIINLLTLKNAAGTLAQEDLAAINAWLEERSERN